MNLHNPSLSPVAARVRRSLHRVPSVFHWAALPAMALAAVLGASPALAQTTPPAGLALPPTPTTRILAIGHLTAKANPASMRPVMADEVRETVRLYLRGKIAEWYVRKDGPGVVFLLDLADPAEAHALLEHLPLGQAGLMEFDLIPLGPLSPLGLLTGDSR